MWFLLPGRWYRRREDRSTDRRDLERVMLENYSRSMRELDTLARRSYSSQRATGRYWPE
jgi:hypothetical protein